MNDYVEYGAGDGGMGGGWGGMRGVGYEGVVRVQYQARLNELVGRAQLAQIAKIFCRRLRRHIFLHGVSWIAEAFFYVGVCGL